MEQRRHATPRWWRDIRAGPDDLGAHRAHRGRRRGVSLRRRRRQRLRALARAQRQRRRARACATSIRARRAPRRRRWRRPAACCCSAPTTARTASSRGAATAARPARVLLANLAADDAPSSSFPAGLTDLNGTLLFAADDGAHGTELWASGGATASTRLVKDINPAGGAFPFFVELRGGRATRVLFAADDGEHGEELWRSDGSRRGHRAGRRHRRRRRRLRRARADPRRRHGVLLRRRGQLRRGTVEERRHGAGHDADHRHQSRARRRGAAPAHGAGGPALFHRHRRRARRRAVDQRRHAGRHPHGQGHQPGRQRLPPAGAVLSRRGRGHALSSPPTTAADGVELWRSDGSGGRHRPGARHQPGPGGRRAGLPARRRRDALLHRRRRHARPRAVDQRRQRARHADGDRHQPDRAAPSAPRPSSSPSPISTRRCSLPPTTARAASSCGAATGPPSAPRW